MAALCALAGASVVAVLLTLFFAANGELPMQISPGDPWAGSRYEREAKEKPVLCDHCGEEVYDPEEVSNGDLLCAYCVKKFYENNPETDGAK